jgi:general secretion pathway protein J
VRSSLRSRRGLTLIEIVVALGILAMMGGIAFSTLATTMGVREALDEAGGSDRIARTALTRITREFQLAYMTKNLDAVQTYQTIFVGKDDDDTDIVWFSTLAHRRKYRDSRECDQGEVTLFTEPDPDEDALLVLYHRAGPRIDHEPDKDGVIRPLARGVSRFDLQYLDPTTGEWKVEWDTQSAETPNRLPRAVQVVLSVVSTDPDDEDHSTVQTYVRTIMLALAPSLTRSIFGRGARSQ